MKRFKIIQTPNNTQMVEIDLTHTQESINTYDIIQALNLLYGSKVEILEKILNNNTQSLQSDIINDYVFKLNVDGNIKYAYNFACCFIDSEAALILVAQDHIHNINEALKNLRGDRYTKHPLYYKDYAQAIYAKFLDAKNIVDRNIS